MFALFFTIIFLAATAVDASSDELSSISVQVNKDVDATITTESTASTIFIDSNKPLTEQEKQQLMDELEQSKNKIHPRATVVTLTYFVIRSGNTTNCTLHTRVNSSKSINNIWWDQIKVQNLNWVNKKTYKTFSSVLRSFRAMTTGTVSVGNLSVPRGEKKVYITTSGTQVASLSDGWGSLINFNGNTSIN